MYSVPQLYNCSSVAGRRHDRFPITRLVPPEAEVSELVPGGVRHHGVVLLRLGRRRGAPVGRRAGLPGGRRRRPGCSLNALGHLVVEGEVGGALHAVGAVVADLVAEGHL